MKTIYRLSMIVLCLIPLFVTGCSYSLHNHEWGSWSVTTTGKEERTCPLCLHTEQGSHTSIEMVQLDAGTFARSGSTVTLSGFKMGKHAVTREQYQAVMGTNPSYFSGSPASGEVQSKRPVEYVTWYDAVDFCNKLSELEGLTAAYAITGRRPASGYPITSASVTANWGASGYRLPTESEWEYACRAGTATNWHFGDTQSELANYAWYSANSNSTTHEVGKKLPNAWGLYDMHGNVWEWCCDRYGSYPTGNQEDPKGATAGAYRVLRGGSWYYSADSTQSGSRGSYNPGYGSYNGGFRLVRP